MDPRSVQYIPYLGCYYCLICFKKADYETCRMHWPRALPIEAITSQLEHGLTRATVSMAVPKDFPRRHPIGGSGNPGGFAPLREENGTSHPEAQMARRWAQGYQSQDGQLPSSVNLTSSLMTSYQESSCRMYDLIREYEIRNNLPPASIDPTRYWGPKATYHHPPVAQQVRQPPTQHGTNRPPPGLPFPPSIPIHPYSNKHALNGRNPPIRTIFLGNLPFDVDIAQLESLLSSLPGYQRSLPWYTALKYYGLNGLAQFDTIANATSAMPILRQFTPARSNRGPLRVEYAKNNIGERGSGPSSPRVVNDDRLPVWMQSMNWLVETSSPEAVSRPLGTFGDTQPRNLGPIGGELATRGSQGSVRPPRYPSGCVWSWPDMFGFLNRSNDGQDVIPPADVQTIVTPAPPPVNLPAPAPMPPFQARRTGYHGTRDHRYPAAPPTQKLPNGSWRRGMVADVAGNPDSLAYLSTSGGARDLEARELIVTRGPESMNWRRGGGATNFPGQILGDGSDCNNIATGVGGVATSGLIKTQVLEDTPGGEFVAVTDKGKGRVGESEED